MKLVNDQPVWEDGDCVTIRFKHKRKVNEDGELLSDTYTYVRRDGYWPGDSGYWSNHDDDEMTVAWNEYRLATMTMVAGPNPPLTGYDDSVEEMYSSALRIAERRLNNVRDIIDNVEATRPLSSLTAEIRAVLG